MELCRRNVAAARADTSSKVYRVYCDGIFDIFHLGHMRMLQQAKHSLGDARKVFLLVGVCSDELTHKFKGKTVMNHQLRCQSVSHCKWVDEVVPEAPWVLTTEFLEKYRIDFVAHDAIPYGDSSGQASDANDVYAPIKRKGKFLETQRTEGISTSDIIMEIIKDYDSYVKRNLERGYTKDQMNVGSSWEVRNMIHEKKKKVETNLKRTKQELEELSDAAKAFILEFNPKYLLQRSYSQRGFLFTPENYAEHLKQSLPQRTEGLIHHGFGLVKALILTSFDLLSYLNPITYCRKSKYK
jgi:choline-phosphate cytidylyltransferase